MAVFVIILPIFLPIFFQTSNVHLKHLLFFMLLISRHKLPILLPILDTITGNPWLHMISRSGDKDSGGALPWLRPASATFKNPGGSSFKAPPGFQKPRCHSLASAPRPIRLMIFSVRRFSANTETCRRLKRAGGGDAARHVEWLT
jgi:hypothetical protein